MVELVQRQTEEIVGRNTFEGIEKQTQTISADVVGEIVQIKNCVKRIEKKINIMFDNGDYNQEK